MDGQLESLANTRRSDHEDEADAGATVTSALAEKHNDDGWEADDEEGTVDHDTAQADEGLMRKRRLRKRISQISRVQSDSDEEKEFVTSLPSVEFSAVEAVLRELCLRGDADRTLGFLTFGCSGQEEDQAGFNSLHYAASTGNDMCCNLLLSAGVSINSMSRDHHTPLYVAAQSGHLSAVSLLLSAGANPDISLLSSGHTALHIAAENGHAETVAELIMAGATLAGLTNNGFTPLHLACQNGHAEVVDLLTTSDDGKECLEVENKSGFTPLLISAWHGHVECCRCLLERGANVDAVNKASRSALLLATVQHPQAAEVILQFNPDLFIRDKEFGWTALHVACFSGHYQLVQSLLKAGSDVQEADLLQRTPLWLASQQGHHGIVATLLEHGAQPSRKSKSGKTPLKVARARNHALVVKELLDALMTIKFARELRVDGNRAHGNRSRAISDGTYLSGTDLDSPATSGNSFPSVSSLDSGVVVSEEKNENEEADGFDNHDHWQDRRRRRVRMAQRHISWSREDVKVRRRQTMIAQMQFTKAFGEEKKNLPDTVFEEENSEDKQQVNDKPPAKDSPFSRRKAKTIPRGLHFGL